MTTNNKKRKIEVKKVDEKKDNDKTASKVAEKFLNNKTISEAVDKLSEEQNNKKEEIKNDTAETKKETNDNKDSKTTESKITAEAKKDCDPIAQDTDKNQKRNIEIKKNKEDSDDNEFISEAVEKLMGNDNKDDSENIDIEQGDDDDATVIKNLKQFALSIKKNILDAQEEGTVKLLIESYEENGTMEKIRNSKEVFQEILSDKDFNNDNKFIISNKFVIDLIQNNMLERYDRLINKLSSEDNDNLVEGMLEYALLINDFARLTDNGINSDSFKSIKNTLEMLMYDTDFINKFSEIFEKVSELKVEDVDITSIYDSYINVGMLEMNAFEFTAISVFEMTDPVKRSSLTSHEYIESLITLFIELNGIERKAS